MIKNLSINEQKLRDLYLMDLSLGKIQGPPTGYTSIDKPYLRTLPEFTYDEDFSKKTIYNMILNSPGNTPNRPALNFYGTKINNKKLYEDIDITATAFKNSGVKKDDLVFMFCLNTPEMVASLYGLNRIGAITEWFNPQGITPGIINKLIKENNVKTIITIDILYYIIKEAIKETNVEQVIVNSTQDSFSPKMKAAYKAQVFGINKIINSNWYKEKLKELKENYINIRESETETDRQLSAFEKMILKLNTYSEKEKIKAKASFYTDNNIDKKFIDWKSFIEKYYREGVDLNNLYKYDVEKTSFIVHTGGTTGPVKRVEMTDYAMNSAIYQSTLLPLQLNVGDKLCQIVPPIVAWGLESHHVARYYNMDTHLIATYDRNEFVNIIDKTKANVYFTVPSFVKELEESKVGNKDLSHIKFIGYGGENMEPSEDKRVDEVLHNHGSICRNQFGYGQNEEFGCFAVNFDIQGQPKKDYGCCGWPMPGNDFMIVDNDTLKELPYGTDENGKRCIGELWVTGPTIMKQYIGEHSKENNKQTIFYRDGKKWIRTGDQAYIDENGKLWYYTRNQRIIRTQRGKIFTNILENIINKYDEVLECCVVSSPHPETVKEASCHIVLKEEYLNLQKEQLEKVIKNIINKIETEVKDYYDFYIPGTYEFRKERIPVTTSMQKMDFTLLEEQNNEEYKKNGGKALKKIRININEHN